MMQFLCRFIPIKAMYHEMMALNPYFTIKTGEKIYDFFTHEKKMLDDE